MRARAGFELDPDDQPTREQAAADEQHRQTLSNPWPRRYLCTDPYCQHAAAPHSHP